MTLAGSLFGLTLLAGLVLAALLVAALKRDDFAFWPPPARGSWQDYAFWSLFRLYCAGIVVCAVADPGGLAWGHPSRVAFGAPVLLAAGAATLYGYGFLGLDNTYGRPAGLVTNGVYAYSRNPQYVASVAAAVAWALTMNSPFALALSFGLLGLYTLFALNEEAWLRLQYGQRYADYAARTPRFVGPGSLRRALRTLRG